MSTFPAIRIDKAEKGVTAAFVDFDEAELMDGDVDAAITHTTVNYKDGLCLGPGGGRQQRRWRRGRCAPPHAQRSNRAGRRRSGRRRCFRSVHCHVARMASKQF